MNKTQQLAAQEEPREWPLKITVDYNHGVVWEGNFEPAEDREEIVSWLDSILQSISWSKDDSGVPFARPQNLDPSEPTAAEECERSRIPWGPSMLDRQFAQKDLEGPGK